MAHQVSLADDEYKLVFSRLGNNLRIGGTAELNGHASDLNRGTMRIHREADGIAVSRRGRDRERQVLTGLRPPTLSTVPITGKSKIDIVRRG